MATATFATAAQRAALAALVKSARGARTLSVEDAAGAGDVSHMTWLRVEAGRPVRLASYLGVERALRWPTGSVAAFLVTGARPVAGALTEAAAFTAVMTSSLPEERKVELLAAVRALFDLHTASRKGHPGG